MKDFDEFFKERLEEESSFPNARKNWNLVSKRMDAYYLGGGQALAKTLKLWKIAASATFLLSVGLACLYTKTLRENRRLMAEIAQASQMEAKTASKAAEVMAPGTATALAVQPAVASGNQPANSVILPQPSVRRTFKSNAIGASLLDKTLLASPAEGKNSKNDVALPAVDLKAPALLFRALKPVNAASGPAKITLPTSTLPVPTIRKFREKPLIAQVGVEGFSGWAQPVEKGISAILGQGITLERPIWKGVSVLASAQWMNHKEHTEKFITRFHPHHPHSGHGGTPPMSHVLAKVESNPRQIRIHTGIGYQVPLPTLIKPGIQLAYGWIYRPETPIVFTWVDDDPGGPGGGGHGGGGTMKKEEQFVEKTDARWFSNNWRLSLGLQYQNKSWTTGIWADYTKQFTANEPIFDAFFVRAGIKYQI